VARSEAVAGGEDVGGGFFQRCLAENRGSTPEERKRIYQQIREMMWLQGRLSIERMCRLAGVSRAGFYRQLERSYGVEQDMKLRSEMQRIALQHRRRYGYRRITAELQQRGFQVNGKRVLRLLREDNLLALRQRKFVVTA